MIGSAGSAAKVRLLTDELGFDHAFDYHGADILAQLRAAAPNGSRRLFRQRRRRPSAGGAEPHAAVRPHPAVRRDRAVQRRRPPPGPNNLTLAIGLGLTLRGFIVSHFNNLRAQFRRDMEGWIGSGAIQ